MACLALVFTVLLIFKSHCLITFLVQTFAKTGEWCPACGGGYEGTN